MKNLLKIFCVMSLLLTASCHASPRKERYLVYEPIHNRCFVTSYLHAYDDGTVDISPINTKVIITEPYWVDMNSIDELEKYKTLLNISDSTNCINVDKFLSEHDGDE